jgi:hypothetical protein
VQDLVCHPRSSYSAAVRLLESAKEGASGGGGGHTCIERPINRSGAGIGRRSDTVRKRQKAGRIQTQSIEIEKEAE